LDSASVDQEPKKVFDTISGFGYKNAYWNWQVPQKLQFIIFMKELFCFYIFLKYNTSTQDDVDDFHAEHHVLKIMHPTSVNLVKNITQQK